MHFDARAEAYDRARPPYPQELWQAVAQPGLLHAGQHALDLGAGTGQATGPLLAAGLHVTAVEPGPALAGHLAASNPAASIVNAHAEDLDLPSDIFDLAVAATSIHWMDLDIVLPKVHRLLKPGATFLVMRTVFGDPAASPTAFRERVAEIVRARTLPPSPSLDATNAAAIAATLTRSGFFTVDDIHTFRWAIELNESQVRDLFSTFSDWTSEEVDRAVEAVHEIGGQVVERYLSWLIVASPTRSVAH